MNLIDPLDEKTGERFQQATKYHRDDMPGGTLDLSQMPSVYKFYRDVPVVDLPDHRQVATLSVAEVLRARHSVRQYSSKPLDLMYLSFLLWASGGVQRFERGRHFRTAPSAGALYPVETYLAVNRVEGLEPGVYHYSSRTHQLELLDKGEPGERVSEAALGQKMCNGAPVVFIWTGVFERCRWKYRQRAYRYVYLDAGHQAENLALAAASVGMGTCQIGALYDDEVNGIIGVDGRDESVIYMSTVGFAGSMGR